MFAHKVETILLLAASLWTSLIGVAAASPITPPKPPPCTDCSQVGMGPDGVVGKAIVVANGRGGVRLVAGGGCPACAWKLVAECNFDKSSGGPVHEPDGCNNGSGKPTCALNTGVAGNSFREFFSSTGAAPWNYVRNVCLGLGQDPISIESLFAQVKQYVDQLVPAAPRVGMQPNGVAIVNLPALFPAGQPSDPGNQSTSKVFFASASAPIAINVTVHPQQWTWTISDAQTATVSRDYCCRYYTPDHSPRAEPDYYASYNFSATGSHTATVAVTWNATMTIAGLGTVPVDGSFTRTSPAYAFTVKQAVSQLESGY